MLDKFNKVRGHHVDAMLCRLQADSSEDSTVRSRSLQVRLGMVTEMAVIEYYIPAGFRTKVRWIPPGQLGKVLPFPATEQKPA